MLTPVNNPKRLKSKRHKKDRMRLGIALIITALYIAFFTAARPVFVHWGWPIPMRTTNHIGVGLTFICMVSGVCLYVPYIFYSAPFTKSFRRKITWWFLAIFVLFIMGYLRTNSIFSALSEFLVFTYLGIFFVLAGDDIFWHQLLKHLTLLFYLGVFLILLFFNTPLSPIVHDNPNSFLENNETSLRFTWSIGYYLRPLISIGILIGMAGMVRPKLDYMKGIQIASLLFYFFIEVGIFKFRSQSIIAMLTIASFYLLKPLLSQKIRPSKNSLFLFLSILAFGVFINTQSWRQFKERTTGGPSGQGILTSRIQEATAFFNDIGIDILWGRGLGGGFNASDVFWDAANWTTLHFGILIFVLKGGLVFLIFFLSFLKTPKHKTSWYTNPFNLIAALLFPIVLLKIMLLPFLLAPEGIFSILPVGFIIGRISLKSPNKLNCNYEYHDIL